MKPGDIIDFIDNVEIFKDDLNNQKVTDLLYEIRDSDSQLRAMTADDELIDDFQVIVDKILNALRAE